MSTNPFSLEHKLLCIDRAIKVVRERQSEREICMSCSRLYWAVNEVMSSRVQFACVLGELGERLVDEYQTFIFKVEHDDDMLCCCSIVGTPYWWNQCGRTYYDERIVALTAFKQYLTEQGE